MNLDHFTRSTTLLSEKTKLLITLRDEIAHADTVLARLYAIRARLEKLQVDAAALQAASLPQVREADAHLLSASDSAV